MTVLTTADGYVFVRQSDGTYSDGDQVYVLSEILSNGHDRAV